MSATESKFKVCLFTAQDIGYQLMQFFAAQSDIDLSVFSYESKNDRINRYRSAIGYCNDNGIDCTVSSSIDESVLSKVREFKPDIILSAYFARIFQKTIIHLPRLGIVNVHPGRLPHYRGEFPTAWAIVNGEKEFGVTLHYIDSGVDTGDLLVQETFPILPDETGYELYRRSMDLGAKLLTDNFYGILKGQLPSQKQQGTGSYFGKFPPRYQIAWKTPRAQIRNQIRAHAMPYFPAYSFLQNKCALFNKASLIDPKGYRSQEVGVIQEVLDNRQFIVSCPDGCLLIEDYSLFPEVSESQMPEYIHPRNRFSDV